MKITLRELREVIGQEVRKLIREGERGEPDLAEQYDEFLDGFGEIKIGDITLWPSEVLKKMDPIAYNEGLRDFRLTNEI